MTRESAVSAHVVAPALLLLNAMMQFARICICAADDAPHADRWEFVNRIYSSVLTGLSHATACVGAVHRISMQDEFRGWAGWAAFMEMQREKQRLQRLAARSAARLKGPKFLAFFDFWRQEQRLAALARGDLGLGGVPPWLRLLHQCGLKCIPAA